MRMSDPDYRESHLRPGIGESYQASFRDPYRSLFWELEKRVLDRILVECLGDGDVHHLDFACGTGRILSHVAGRAHVSVGVDVSASMLAVAKESSERSEIYQADLTTNDILEERKFNLITAFRFFPNAQPALRNDAMRVLVRHLGEGGRLVFNNHKNLASVKYRLARLRGRGGFKGMSLAEASELVSKNGLEIQKSYALGFTPASDRHMIIPAALLRWLEGGLSKWPAIKPWGENVIFVCRRAEGG